MKQTADKAHVAGGATFVSLLLAMWGLGEPPPMDQLQPFLADMATALAGAVASWLATYFKRNREKP